MFLLIIAVYALIILAEVPNLFKNKDIKTLIVYLFLITAPLIIDVLLSFNVEIPSPSNEIKKIIFLIIERR